MNLKYFYALEMKQLKYFVDLCRRDQSSDNLWISFESCPNKLRYVLGTMSPYESRALKEAFDSMLLL